MTPAGGIAARVRGVRAEAAGPMHVIRMGLDIVVDVRMDRLVVAAGGVALVFFANDREMFTALAFEPRALDHVEQVRDHTHLGPKLSVFIEINAPRIAPT